MGNLSLLAENVCFVAFFQRVGSTGAAWTMVALQQSVFYSQQIKRALEA